MLSITHVGELAKGPLNITIYCGLKFRLQNRQNPPFSLYNPSAEARYSKGLYRNFRAGLPAIIA